MQFAAASAWGHLVKRQRTRDPSRPTPPLINGGVRLASSVDTKTDRWRGDRRGYVKANKSLDLLAKRGAVGTGGFDGHRRRIACGNNVNLN